MMFLRVKNWQKFQHYRQRNPPWIRLYNELLDDYDFARLQDASKWHAVGIWLLASRFDNKIPDDPIWIGQRINARSRVNLPELLSSGFIERYDDASDMLAPCTQGANPETEAEGETEAEKKKKRGVRKPRWRVCPEGWNPNDKHAALAIELGVDVAIEAAKFKDFEFRHPKTDADRAFSGWLRRAAEFKAEKQRNGNGKQTADEKLLEHRLGMENISLGDSKTVFQA